MLPAGTAIPRNSTAGRPTALGFPRKLVAFARQPSLPAAARPFGGFRTPGRPGLRRSVPGWPASPAERSCRPTRPHPTPTDARGELWTEDATGRRVRVNDHNTTGHGKVYRQLRALRRAEFPGRRSALPGATLSSSPRVSPVCGPGNPGGAFSWRGTPLRLPAGRSTKMVPRWGWGGPDAPGIHLPASTATLISVGAGAWRQDVRVLERWLRRRHGHLRIGLWPCRITSPPIQTAPPALRRLVGWAPGVTAPASGIAVSHP